LHGFLSKNLPEQEIRKELIPQNVEILGSSCFSYCGSLSSLLFESESRLTRIEFSAFSSSSLESIMIPRNVEILCSSCFSCCESLSSISFESGSRLRRIEWRACDARYLRSIAIPPNLSFIDCEAFDTACTLTAVDCTSSPELARWCACHSRCNRHSAVDFRRTLRLGSGLPTMTDCLIDLSAFDIVRRLEVGGEGEGSCLLSVRRSDGIQFVVELIGRFEAGKENGGESEIEREVEKLLNLKHGCIAAPIGFAVSNASADGAEL
jgi:hypothetical protein